jgi:hypothetical protein
MTRTRILFLAALVAVALVLPPWVARPRAASAFVQAFSNHLVVSGSPTVALTGVTAGNTLVFCVYMQSNNRTLDSMSGGSNSYSETVARTINTGSNHAMTMWRAFNVSGGDYTVTLTMSASSTYSIGVVELSGVTTTDPLDSAPAGEVAEPGQTLDVGPTATLAQANEILVGCGGGSVSSRPFNAMSGWTNRVDLTNPYLAMWTKTVSATTAQSLPLDTAPNTQFIIGNLASFTDAGGGGGGGSAPRLGLLGVGGA